MDPMDFTMDDSNNALAASAHRYQCQQPQASQSHSQTNGSNFASQAPSQARDSQHYDPVHDSSGWYQHNNSSAPSRPPYLAPQNISTWAAPHTDSTAHNWFQSSDMDRLGRNQEYNSQEYRRTFMPWGESRGFDAFTHTGYIPPGPPPTHPISNMATEVRPPRGFEMDQQQQYMFSREMPRAAISTLQYPSMPSANIASSEPRPPVSGNTPSSMEPSPFQQPPASTDIRSGFSRTTRPSVTRHEDILEGSRRRRLAAAWDSDDDEESLASYQRMEVARRHAAETLFGGGYDDERSTAVLRSAMAAAKRLPTKEALDSLESVKVADLKDADRTCIICYNEFGVSNPEGDIENPIRLPKCKHIFGDKCIKKWFEDSDSCPYCRDKLPSEAAAKRSLAAYQSLRAAHREQLRLATMTAQRNRYASYTAAVDSENSRSPGTAQRAQEDYDFAIARHNESWSFNPSNRNTAGDSPERRRQARGRHSGIRGPHFLGRPTSVGSVRPSPAFTHQPPRNFADYYTPQRRNANADGSARDSREARDTGARIGVAEARPAIEASPFRSGWGQPSTQPSGSAVRQHTDRPIAGSSMPTEEASPPVAVGSGAAARRRVEPPGPASSRLSLDSDSSDSSSDARSRQSPDQVNHGEVRGQRQIELSPGIPSFGALPEVSNNPMARFGSDSSNDVDDLAHIGRMDAGIPPGWGSIN